MKYQASLLASVHNEQTATMLACSLITRFFRVSPFTFTYGPSYDHWNVYTVFPDTVTSSERTNVMLATKSLLEQVQ